MLPQNLLHPCPCQPEALGAKGHSHVDKKVARSRLNEVPRRARIDAPSALHHTAIGKIERRNILEDDKDRVDFLQRLSFARLGRPSQVVVDMMACFANSPPGRTTPTIQYHEKTDRKTAYFLALHSPFDGQKGGSKNLWKTAGSLEYPLSHQRRLRHPALGALLIGCLLFQRQRGSNGRGTLSLPQ